MCVKCSYVANRVWQVFAIRRCACKLHVHWQLNMRATSPPRVHEVGPCEYRAGTRSKIRALLKGFSTQSCFRGDNCRWLLVSHSLKANFWLTKSLALNHLSRCRWYEVASVLERIYWERSVSSVMASRSIPNYSPVVICYHLNVKFFWMLLLGAFPISKQSF